MTEGVALAHDYATQRGGAERVALWLAEAFPGSPMYTTLYDPAGTFPEFSRLDLRTSALDRVGALRHHHRLALPLLAPAVSAQRVDADVLLASSTGWAHGYRGASRTVVYCHAPARWLYQRDRYLGGRDGASTGDRLRGGVAAAALTALSPALRGWDRRAAGRADVYLANSTVTQRAVREAYGIEAEILPPPPAMLPAGPEREVPGIEPGFLLCVARLLPYKNVDVLVEAARLAGRHLVIVGDGPDRARLEGLAARGRPVSGRWGTPSGAGGGTTLLGRVDDPELRWLYRSCSMLVAASYEDYGLSPLEAGAFGRPSVVLRDGGYLDTVVEGVTGAFFDAPEPDLVARAVQDASAVPWEDDVLTSHVETFALPRFVARLREVVEEQRGLVHAGASTSGERDS
ncbi:glycosyltransferase [Oerskovia turbata]|uniref:D-inositol 3-phosphate glycosyltransferase n=1 Tax=Oerskovia turbata TaxID=1713 RepID=A0A4Q1KW90_9CELL|nr:glycosyltransferase [Oerskovia turbata]RXR26848.1 glycosyltransferase [Oerskovia turbata]RXR34581.1 glycosyltransferase [Oerskovia turbata]